MREGGGCGTVQEKCGASERTRLEWRERAIVWVERCGRVGWKMRELKVSLSEVNVVVEILAGISCPRRAFKSPKISGGTSGRSCMYEQIQC